MSNVRCTYCGRYYKKIKNEDKCHNCNTQLKKIIESLNQRYINAIIKTAVI